MALPARRWTELNTWRGPTRSSSSTGGTIRTTILRLAEPRRAPALLDPEGTPPLARRVGAVRKRDARDGGFRRMSVANRRALLRTMPGRVEEKIMTSHFIGIAG